MSLFQKVAQYLANELITKRLAQSQSFQRMAVRTHEHVSKTQAIAKSQGETVGKTLNSTSKQAAEAFQKQKGFFAEVREEMLKEMKIKK